MGVQFFSDYIQVLKRLQTVSATPEEQELNKTLLKQENMESTYPDAIMDEVNKNIIFRTLDECASSETLMPKRIYIINDLIEVVKSDKIPQYTSIDKPCYQVKIEESERKGFFKLKQVQNNSPILNLNREYEINYDPSLTGTSSKSDSDTDYYYSMITELKTPKPLQLNEEIARRDTLPESCFSTRHIKYIPEEILNTEDDEETRQEILINLKPEDFFKKIIYINSKGFMKYFQNGLFPVTLGKSLGFTAEAILTATSIPGKIFCEEFDIETNVNKLYEIIPAVSIPWPDDQTINFVYRDERNTIFDTRTGVKYQWPTTEPGGMIDEISKMSAVLVPKGFAKKKGINRDANLEWEINFPKVERYLEARMSHPQIKCFLTLLTLHKSFIAPTTKQYGLLSEHIRTHMYWQCEKDYRNWPEHRLGTKILRVIKDLQHALFMGFLPNYFIKEQNVFENIPKKYLNFAQKVLLDILENPVPYFLKALSNLRYLSGKFYPPLDLKELYESITIKSSAILVNPQLGLNLVPQLKRRIYKDPENQMKHIKYLKKKEEILREQLREKQLQELNEINHNNLSEDFFNIHEPIDKELDIWKTKAILTMFIKNFIDIGKRSSNLSTNKEQAMFYFKQASYLTKILLDTSTAFLTEVQELQQIIALEESRIKRRTVRSLSNNAEEKPPTPLRNSFSIADLNQQLKSGSIRLNHLHNSYLINQPTTPSAIKKIKLPKNGLQKKVVAFIE